MEKEELKKVLNMVSDGTMKPEDAVRLIEAMQGQSTVDAETRSSTTKGKANWVKIRVTNIATGKTKVNVRIPLWLVRGALKLGGKGLNLVFFDSDKKMNEDLTEKLNEMVSLGETGTLLDVTDEEEGEHVEIVLE